MILRSHALALSFSPYSRSMCFRMLWSVSHVSAHEGADVCVGAHRLEFHTEQQNGGRKCMRREIRRVAPRESLLLRTWKAEGFGLSAVAAEPLAAFFWRGKRKADKKVHGLNLKNEKGCVTAWLDANGRKEGPTNPNRNVNRKKINPATMVVWGRQRQFFVYRTPTVTSKLGELFMERHIKRRAEWWEHVAGRTDCK